MGGVGFTVITVGRPRLAFARSGVDHYARRIKPHASLHLEAVRDEPVRKGGRPRDALARQAERLRLAAGKCHRRVALDAGGRCLDSESLASLLSDWMVGGVSRIAFLVGGPHGLAPDVAREADLVLSLSPMTLSHEMTLLVLLEQLYRALAILNGLPYPK